MQKIVAVILVKEPIFMANAVEYIKSLGFPEEWTEYITGSTTRPTRYVDHINICLEDLNIRFSDKPLTPKTLAKLPHITETHMYIQVENYQQLVARYTLIGKKPPVIKANKKSTKLNIKSHLSKLIE